MRLKRAAVACSIGIVVTGTYVAGHNGGARNGTLGIVSEGHAAEQPTGAGWSPT